jgi:hypothetical protein
MASARVGSPLLKTELASTLRVFQDHDILVRKPRGWADGEDSCVGLLGLYLHSYLYPFLWAP